MPTATQFRHTRKQRKTFSSVMPLTFFGMMLTEPGLSLDLQSYRHELLSFQMLADEQSRQEEEESDLEAELQADGDKTEDKLPEEPQPVAESKAAVPGLNLTYGEDGFTLTTADDLFSLAIQNRLQFRYANPFDDDPRSHDDLATNQNSFMIRRARTKLNGHAYWPWLKFSMQYDWKDPILRDMNLTLEKFSWATLWLGRGKVVYNDERVTSSGKQQFVNRSIVNDIFTVDRQQGLQLKGQLFPGTWHDLSYAAGVFTGLGVGDTQNDDQHLMYSGRLQWNPLGQAIGFSQSDLSLSDQPALSLAVAASTNQSKCTAFTTDQDSCQSLPGYKIGKDGQYRLNQLMEEVRFRWQGFSVNHELHWKQVVDTLKTTNEGSASTDMMGGLLQLGYFPHTLLQVIPKQLELAGRYAFVDPDTTRNQDMQHEFSGVVNYFFNGHSNKISLQLSHLIVEDPTLNLSQAAQRLWLQWDLSF